MSDDDRRLSHLHDAENTAAEDSSNVRTRESMKICLELQNDLLKRMGLKGDIARAVVSLIVKGKLLPSDLDEECIEALNEATSVVSLEVLKKYEEVETSEIKYKSAYICGLLKTALEERRTRRAPSPDLVAVLNDYSRRGYPFLSDGRTCWSADRSGYRARGSRSDVNGNSGAEERERDGVIKREIHLTAAEAMADPALLAWNDHGPDPKRMKEVLTETKYDVDITVGQRKYTQETDYPLPLNGHEVFICRIPREVFEDELLPLFESCGIINQFRLMLDAVSGWVRGYAFCRFTTREAASCAVREVRSK